MLDKDTIKTLEKNVLERINKLYPEKSVSDTIAKIAVQAIIITLQEYEKLNSNTD